MSFMKTLKRTGRELNLVIPLYPLTPITIGTSNIDLLLIKMHSSALEKPIRITAMHVLSEPFPVICHF